MPTIVERLAASSDAAETRALLKALQKVLRTSPKVRSLITEIAQIDALFPQVDTATKRSIFNALASHVTGHAEDAETLSLLLDILLLLRVTKTNFTLASKMFFSLASSDENDQVRLHDDNQARTKL